MTMQLHIWWSMMGQVRSAYAKLQRLKSTTYSQELLTKGRTRGIIAFFARFFLCFTLIRHCKSLKSVHFTHAQKIVSVLTTRHEVGPGTRIRRDYDLSARFYDLRYITQEEYWEVYLRGLNWKTTSTTRIVTNNACLCSKSNFTKENIGHLGILCTPCFSSNILL